MNIRIYQVNLGRDEKRIAFQGLESLKRLQENDGIKSGIYDCVFSGEVNCDGLEDVFQKFNIDHPSGYKGRSLSVSDIIEVVKPTKSMPGFISVITLDSKEWILIRKKPNRTKKSASGF